VAGGLDEDCEEGDFALMGMGQMGKVGTLSGECRNRDAKWQDESTYDKHDQIIEKGALHASGDLHRTIKMVMHQWRLLFMRITFVHST